MDDEEPLKADAERRTAAGRIASWFGTELDLLRVTLRNVVAEAPVRASQTSDQEGAERILTLARACSKRISTLLGLRAEPWLPASSNLEQALAATLAEHPDLRQRGIFGDILPSATLPLPSAALRTVVKELLDNACAASALGPKLELRERGGEVEFRVVSDGLLSEECARLAPFPFFTTKAGHPGLGLSLVHVAAENQGGRLQVASRANETSMALVLPTTQNAVKPGARESPESNLSFACHLAAALAHDANNALMAALGWAEILGDARNEAERDEALSTLAQAADYLEAMSYLLPYASRPTRAAEAVDLGHAFERMQPLLRAVLEHKADRRIALHVVPLGGARVAMSEDALRSVVLRLAENARDGMPSGGTWSVGWESGKEGLLLTLSAEVQGTGPLAQLPPASWGRGPDRVALGLAVARDLVQTAGGTFELAPQNPPTKTVRIRLPGAAS